MNVFVNGMFIFVFIFIALFLKFPVIKNKDALVNKLYLFVGIFALEIIVLSLDKIQDDSNCKMRTGDIVKEAAKIALLAVVAYSVVTDIINIPTYRNYVEYFLRNDRYSSVFTGGAISLQIIVYKILDNFIFPRSC